MTNSYTAITITTAKQTNERKITLINDIEILFSLIRIGLADDRYNEHYEGTYFHIQTAHESIWITEEKLIAALNHNNGILYTLLVTGYCIPVADLFPTAKIVRVIASSTIFSGIETIKFGEVFGKIGLFPASGYNAPLQSNLALELKDYFILTENDTRFAFALQICGEIHDFTATVELYIKLWAAMVKYGDTTWLTRATTTSAELKNRVPVFRSSNSAPDNVSLVHFIKYKGAWWLRALGRWNLYKLVRRFM